MSRSPGLTFSAWRGDAFIAPIEVILVVGAATMNRRWSLQDAEFAPGWQGSAKLARLAAEHEPVPTLKLVELLADGVQLVDGSLVGDDEAGQRPPLVIRSVRGDDWDVEVEEPAALSAIRTHFANAQDLPGG